jgi:exosome complex exonuclease DIS3/RRP44
VKDYVEGVNKYPELCDKVSKTEKQFLVGSGAKVIFPQHLTPTEIRAKLKRGDIKQGCFSASTENYLEGYVMIEGMDKPILIQGLTDLNRSTHEDVVAVEIFPEDKWAGPSAVLLQESDEDKGDAVEETEVLVPDKSSDVRPTGRVVGIIRRKWRQYCGILQPSVIKEVSNPSI